MKKIKREIKIIEASGKPHEIGIHYGTSAKVEIKKALDLHCKKLGMENSTDSINALVQKYIPTIQVYLPDTFEMMKGMAKGAKLDFEEVIFLNIASDIAVAKASSGLCTSFAASGEATIDGETIVGQNLDWCPEAEEITLIMKFIHSNSPSILGVGLAGCPPSFGLNSAGIGVAMNSLIYQANVPPTYIALPVISLLGSKLLSSKSVSKAIATIATAPRPIPGALDVDGWMIANREGDIVYVEPTWNDLSVIYPEKSFLAHGNHFETERFKSVDLAGTYCPDSYIRSGRLAKLMSNNYGKLTVDMMKDFLQDHNNYPNSICRHPENEAPPEEHASTFSSFIVHPKEQKLYVTVGRPCEYEYMEYIL